MVSITVSAARETWVERTAAATAAVRSRRRFEIIGPPFLSEYSHTFTLAASPAELNSGLILTECQPHCHNFLGHRHFLLPLRRLCDVFDRTPIIRHVEIPFQERRKTSGRRARPLESHVPFFQENHHNSFLTQACSPSVELKHRMARHWKGRRHVSQHHTEPHPGFDVSERTVRRIILRLVFFPTPRSRTTR